MSLVNTNYSFVEGSEVQSFQNHNIAVSAVGNRQDDKRNRILCRMTALPSLKEHSLIIKILTHTIVAKL